MRFPALKFNVWHGQVGSLTEHQGYDFGVECAFPHSPANASDNVALSVDLCNLTSTPRVMAEVMWGHPSGDSEGAFKDWQSNADWPEATRKTLAELGEALPKLMQAFQSAVERGAPPNSNSQLV